MELRVDPDRANLARVSNPDVAVSSTSAMSGYPLTTLRGRRQADPGGGPAPGQRARANFSDIQNLYVYSMTSAQKVPLRQVSSTVVQDGDGESPPPQPVPDRHRVLLSVAGGQLRSTVVGDIWPKLEAFEQLRPVGYKLEVGGEKEQKDDNFVELLVILAICVAAIFMALVFQFHNAVKPFIVFSAIPYGMVGAFAGLVVMDAPFSFMAFLLHLAHRRDRQPRHRAVRPHRGEARRGRAHAPGPARRRHHPTAAGAHHCGRHGVRPLPAGDARRPALGAPLLRADRRPGTAATFITLILVPVDLLPLWSWT